MEIHIAGLCQVVLASLVLCEVSRCPYCPDRTDKHWIKWGFYWRYVQGREEKIPVGRNQCRFVRRTFSLLPDGVLPYRYLRADAIVQGLEALFLREVPASTYARKRTLPRTTVRRMKATFATIVRHLRLAGQEGSLGPAAFLRRLFGLPVDRIAEIFRDWKEREPKHSLLGIYAR